MSIVVLCVTAVRCWGEYRGAPNGDMTMPRNKDLKRLVRARMTKTGEAYTTARSQITKKTATKKTDVAYAALAGMSDDVVKAKTGCTWDRWVRALDKDGAAQMSHREITSLVSSKYKVPDWWTQMVTVGYERIKGLRARGQRRNGTYEATKSRTFNVPVTTLFEAWAKPAVRRRWLKDATVKVRTSTAPKSIRLDWYDSAIIEVGFLSKGKSKSSVALAHTKLPDREAADWAKRYWSEQLDSLGEVLAEL